MPSDKKLHFAIDIAATPEVVFRVMLDPETYKAWTQAFVAGSYYEGAWRQGERITFLSPSGDGMLSEIVEHRPNEFTSIRHLGFIHQGVVDTESDAVKAFVPAYENYTFAAIADGTRLEVDMDITEEYAQYMNDTWPKALDELKALCERPGNA